MAQRSSGRWPRFPGVVCVKFKNWLVTGRRRWLACCLLEVLDGAGGQDVLQFRSGVVAASHRSFVRRGRCRAQCQGMSRHLLDAEEESMERKTIGELAGVAEIHSA